MSVCVNIKGMVCVMKAQITLTLSLKGQILAVLVLLVKDFLSALVNSTGRMNTILPKDIDFKSKSTLAEHFYRSHRAG